MIRRLTTILAFVSCLLSVPGGGVSALEIRITAEAKLEVSVTGAGTLAQVAGTLRDDLGRGLAQREVLVQIDARETGVTLVTRKVYTDARGRFGVQEELQPGPYEVFVRFDKTDHLDGIADSRPLQLVRQEVELRAYAPPFVFGREHAAWLSVRAVAGSIPYQGPAEVAIGGNLVGKIELDASGRGTFDVAPHLAVGPNDIRVRTPGSAHRSEREIAVSSRFASAVEIEAAIDERLERLQRGLAVSGVVRDEFGPLSGVRVVGRIEPVELFDATARDVGFSAASRTDDDGRFVAFVAGSKLTDGRWRGVAEFVPPLGDPIKVDAGSTTIDARAYRAAVNGFGVLALLLGGLLLIARGGQSLLMRWREWHKRREQAARQAAALEEVETIVPVFLDDEEASSSAPGRSDIGGMVWDVWQQQPVVGALVELRVSQEQPALTAMSDAAGRFRFVDVEPGRWEMSVRSFGFIRGHLQFGVPHDGRLGNFRLDLIAVPLKIRRLYGSVLEHSVGEDLWGKLSPREIEEKLDEIWPSDAPVDRRHIRDAVSARLADEGQQDDGHVDGVAVLAALTEVVEESYFSGRQYGEPAFLLARSLALELRARRDAMPSPEDA